MSVPFDATDAALSVSLSRADSLAKELRHVHRQLAVKDGALDRVEQSNRELSRRCDQLRTENKALKAQLASIGGKPTKR